MELADAQGFMFDLDGTLVQRARSGTTVIPGADELIAELRRSGRPLAVFTNASHVAPSVLAHGVREIGLDLRDEELLTPVCSAISHLRRTHDGAQVLVVGADAVRERMRADGIRICAPADGARAEVVFVAHVDQIDLDLAEAAARAILAGAAFLTANAARAYAGADGPILSRGAMVTAAIAKAADAQAEVVGKPSMAAVRELSERLGVASAQIAVTGDDIGMDIALGRLGGSFTVLVATGISGDDLEHLPAAAHPDLVVGSVAELVGRVG